MWGKEWKTIGNKLKKCWKGGPRNLDKEERIGES